MTLQNDSAAEVWGLGHYLSRRRTRVRPGAGTGGGGTHPSQMWSPTFQRSHPLQPQDGQEVWQAAGGRGGQPHCQPPPTPTPQPGSPATISSR